MIRRSPHSRHPCKEKLPLFLTKRTLFFLIFTVLAAVLAVTGVSGDSQFYFMRLQYDSGDGALYPQLANIKGWFTDYSDIDGRVMDEALTGAVRRLTTIDAGDPVVARPGPELMQYPFVYTVEPEQMVLSDRDAAWIREWILRGGFWMLDDFHGCAEFDHTMNEIRKVTGGLSIFSETPFVKLTPEHPIFHTVFDIGAIVQVPVVYMGWAYAIDPAARIWEAEPPCHNPEVWMWDGSESGAGHILMIYNSDLGDSVEHADDPQYPMPFSAYGYRVFTNAIVYALSH